MCIGKQSVQITYLETLTNHEYRLMFLYLRECAPRAHTAATISAPRHTRGINPYASTWSQASTPELLKSSSSFKKKYKSKLQSFPLTFHWNLDSVPNGSYGKVVGSHNQFIRSTVWSLQPKDFHNCWLIICYIKNESILGITCHLNCASSLIPRNSSCRKRGGIRGEKYFYLIQRRTIKSVCPLKGDVVIFHWIQWTWRSRNKGWCLLFAKKENKIVFEKVRLTMWSTSEVLEKERERHSYKVYWFSIEGHDMLIIPNSDKPYGLNTP